MKTILRKKKKGIIQIKISKSIKRTNLGLSQHPPSKFYNWSSMQVEVYINLHFEYSPLELFSYLSLVVVN